MQSCFRLLIVKILTDLNNCRTLLPGAEFATWSQSSQDRGGLVQYTRPAGEIDVRRSWCGWFDHMLLSSQSLCMLWFDGGILRERQACRCHSSTHLWRRITLSLKSSAVALTIIHEHFVTPEHRWHSTPPPRWLLMASWQLASTIHSTSVSNLDRSQVAASVRLLA